MKNNNCRANYQRCRDNRPLAMSYVRKQQWCRVYKMEVGMDRGTIFNELDKPFNGTRGTGRGVEIEYEG